MATVKQWAPFGVSLDLEATGSNVVRKSATEFTVTINASWKAHWSGSETTYGMDASSGGNSITLSSFNSAGNNKGSGSFTGTYSVSGNGATTKEITVTFKNYDYDGNPYATKNISFSVSVPAWTSYTISYNANGGSGAPSSQTKWKDQTLTLSSTRPTRTGYSFKGWATSASGAVAYAAGASYTANAGATLYAVWQANAYTVSFDANGGTGAPGNQTKYYDTTLKLSSVKPTRTNYNFLGWGTSANATTVTYTAGGNYTANAAVTLYAVWELAYIKPLIYNISVYRCDFYGNEDENGTYWRINYEWETTYSSSNHKVAIDPSPGAVNQTSTNKTGTYGTVGQIMRGLSPVDLDKSYKITITITDEVGYSTAITTLNGTVFPVDAIKTEEGAGVAFGKPAQKVGVADFAFDAEFNGAVSGNVLGLNKLPEIPEGAELNDYMTTGAWAIYSNAVAATITCGGVLLGTNDSVPPARACRFEVNSATGEGIRAEQWSYLRQRLIPYNSSNPVFERDITRNDANVWTYFDWWKSSLTPAAAEKVYSKAAIMLGLNANSAMSIASTYTKIPFDLSIMSLNDRLTLYDNSVRIGADIDFVKVSANILVKCGAAGTRHFRIQKISGSTTTSHAWNVINTDAGNNTAYTFTPIIVPVKEGDYIRIVYYTADTTDYVVSGNSSNGRQSYLTVEEL